MNIHPSVRSSLPSPWQTWRGYGTTPTRTRAAGTAAARTDGTTTRSATAPSPRGRAPPPPPTPGRGRTPPSATAKTTETTTARRPGTARTGELLQPRQGPVHTKTVFFFVISNQTFPQTSSKKHIHMASSK